MPMPSARQRDRGLYYRRITITPMSVKPSAEASTAARRRTSTIVAYEIIGFLAIIALSWINELLGLPSLIFGSDHLGGWHESLLETIIILLVAILVVVMTRLLVSRLHYLEEFLRLCAWCRKLHTDDEWIPLEDFFERRFDTRTSHGICPACRAEQRKSIEGRRTG
jgi:hypothetical protein